MWVKVVDLETFRVSEAQQAEPERWRERERDRWRVRFPFKISFLCDES